ncbi:MAG: ATP-binding cassette domain-containing protein [Microcoleaceae cyanobacterium]
MIEVENLCKIYGSTSALQNVSFSVKPGEILGFLGPNGAGKTTTLRILSGYLPASSGTATVAGYDVHEQSMAVRQRIGYLPETPPLYPDMTVEGFLYFVSRIKQVKGSLRKRSVESAMVRCGLEDRRNQHIRKLSKGYRQRVGIAQAIVHDPDVIVLDEPTVGLDPRQIIEVRNLIKSLAGDHTIILSTHILPEVSMTCDRVAIINRGQVVATGLLDELMAELTAGSGYELEIEGELSPQKLNSLEQIKGVRTIQPLEGLSVDSSRHHLQVFCEPQTEPGPEIVSALVLAGLNLYEMRRTRASLEEVFLQLTTQQDTVTTESEIESEETVNSIEENPDNIEKTEVSPTDSELPEGDEEMK